MKREKKISSLILEAEIGRECVCVCVGGGGGGGGGGIKFLREKVQLLSRFLDVPTVGSRQAKKQSCSMLQGLLVGTNFAEFRQLWEVGIFFYLI